MMKHLLSFVLLIQISPLLFAQDFLPIVVNEEVVDSVRIYTIEQDSNGALFAKRSYFDSAHTKLAWIRHYKSGKQNGIYKTYFPDGNLMQFGVYGYGVKHGDYTLYNKDGSIAVKGKFKDGVKHGYWAFKNDNCYGRFKNGRKKGVWKCYEGFEEIKTKY